MKRRHHVLIVLAALATFTGGCTPGEDGRGDSPSAASTSPSVTATATPSENTSTDPTTEPTPTSTPTGSNEWGPTNIAQIERCDWKRDPSPFYGETAYLQDLAGAAVGTHDRNWGPGNETHVVVSDLPDGHTSTYEFYYEDKNSARQSRAKGSLGDGELKCLEWNDESRVAANYLVDITNNGETKTAAVSAPSDGETPANAERFSNFKPFLRAEDRRLIPG